jgi:hypothetical protein
MGRKKRPGFADVHTTRSSFHADEVRCPNCRRKVGPADGPKFIATFGDAEPTLATLTCERCRTMLSIRFVEALPGT